MLSADPVRGVYPSRRPGYPAPEVLDWDPDSGLVRVGDLYAQLGFSVTDPYRTDLIVSLGWHDDGPAPTVLGTVEVLLEETGTYVRERTGELDIDPGTVDYREVREATIWPEDRPEAGGPAAAGVVAGVRLAGIVEAADRAEVRAEVLDLRNQLKEVVPALEHIGAGMLPYYPLASGLLTGKYRRGAAAPEGSRLAESRQRSRPRSRARTEAVAWAPVRGISTGDSLPPKYPTLLRPVGVDAGEPEPAGEQS